MHYRVFELDVARATIYPGISKGQPVGQTWPLTCLYKYSFIGTWPRPFIYTLCVSACLLQWQCWIGATNGVACESENIYSLALYGKHLSGLVSVPEASLCWCRREAWHWWYLNVRRLLFPSFWNFQSGQWTSFIRIPKTFACPGICIEQAIQEVLSCIHPSSLSSSNGTSPRQPSGWYLICNISRQSFLYS